MSEGTRIRNASDATTLAIVRRYASGTAPFLAIPIWDADAGKWTRATFRRAHLQAAMASPGIVRASYIAATHTLVLNGGRNRWALKNQDYIVTGSFLARYELEAWARVRRKAIVSKSATKGERKAAAIEKEIGILQRRLHKITDTRPVNPLCQAPRQNGDWYRNGELAWHRGKQTRKALSRVFTVPALAIGMRRDWKALYAAAARVLGREIADSAKHSRVTRLTRGPSLDVYVKYPARYLAGMDAPYRRGAHDWNHRAAETREWAEEAQRMRDARMRYLETVSHARAIEAEIANLREFQKAAREADTAATAAAT